VAVHQPFPTDHWRPLADAEDLNSWCVVVRISFQYLVQLPAFRCEDKQRTCVFCPRTCSDEMALFVKALEEYTMCGTCREALRGGSEWEFDDRHAPEGRL
jgi:hypothetical protein